MFGLNRRPPVELRWLDNRLAIMHDLIILHFDQDALVAASGLPDTGYKRFWVQGAIELLETGVVIQDMARGDTAIVPLTLFSNQEQLAILRIYCEAHNCF